MSTGVLWHMAKCLDCEKPETPWQFRSHADRAEWAGQHRLKTGHRPIHMWLEVTK